MTAEEKVKIQFPNARAERYVQGKIKGLQRTYWLIWSDFSLRGGVRIGEGATRSSAWVDAKRYITP